MSHIDIKKAVVTGATGMIGSELIRQLVSDVIEMYQLLRIIIYLVQVILEKMQQRYLII